MAKYFITRPEIILNGVSTAGTVLLPFIIFMALLYVHIIQLYKLLLFICYSIAMIKCRAH